MEYCFCLIIDVKYGWNANHTVPYSDHIAQQTVVPPLHSLYKQLKYVDWSCTEDCGAYVTETVLSRRKIVLNYGGGKQEPNKTIPAFGGIPFSVNLLKPGPLEYMSQNNISQLLNILVERVLQRGKDTTAHYCLPRTRGCIFVPA